MKNEKIEKIEKIAEKFMSLDEKSKQFIAGYMSARIEAAEEIKKLKEEIKAIKAS